MFQCKMCHGQVTEYVGYVIHSTMRILWNPYKCFMNPPSWNARNPRRWPIYPSFDHGTRGLRPYAHFASL